MDNNLDKIYQYVFKEEERFYDLAYKAMEENNTTANMLATAQAASFQKVRYFIEDLQE